MIIKCNLSDYYDTGIKLTQALHILAGIYNHNEKVSIRLQETKKTREKMLYTNMSSLGFLDGPPTKPVITPRGFSFLCGRILLSSNVISDDSVGIQCARLALLKAVADEDWQCFTKMVWLDDFEGMSGPELHKYYEYDTERNFKHRRGLHRSISRETGFTATLRKMDIKSSSQIALLNPYNESFEAQAFFPFRIRISSESEVLSALSESLKIYRNLFKEHSPFGFSELLKAITIGSLLDTKGYCHEPVLCEICLRELYKRRLALFRSSQPSKLTGRGFYIMKGSETISYPFFRLKLQ